MNVIEEMIGFYCKIALIPSDSSTGSVQSGFIKNVNNEDKIVTLENEDGVVHLSFYLIQAIKKINEK